MRGRCPGNLHAGSSLRARSGRQSILPLRMLCPPDLAPMELPACKWQDLNG